MDEPKFENSSDARVFLGHFQDHDLYFDPQTGIPTVIARFGDAGPDYISGLAQAATNPVIAEGKRLAIEQDLLLVPDDLDLDLVNFWKSMSYPNTLVPYLATNNVVRWIPTYLSKYEIRLQRWPWKPYDDAGWRWDLLSSDTPYSTRAFGYEATARKAETVAVANALVHISEDAIHGPE